MHFFKFFFYIFMRISKTTKIIVFKIKKIIIKSTIKITFLMEEIFMSICYIRF